MDRADYRFDFGALTLSSDLGTNTGWFGMRVEGETSLLSATYVVAGYPGDKPAASLWQASGRIDSVDPFHLYYRIDDVQGNSGGPVWRETGDVEWYVIGINSFEQTRGGIPYRNAAVRVTAGVLQSFVDWRNEAGTPAAPQATPVPTPAPQVTLPRSIVPSPRTISGQVGSLGMSLITVTATEGSGDLVVAASGGELLADALLTPNSCDGGSRRCVGVGGGGTRSITIPDNGNQIGTVLLTLAGTVARTTEVTLTATQARPGLASWSAVVQVVALPVVPVAQTPTPATPTPTPAATPSVAATRTPVAPFSAYGSGLRPGDRIEAFIRGRSCGTAVADANGNWLLQIGSTALCGPANADAVTFNLNGVPTTARETYRVGGAPADVANGITLIGQAAEGEFDRTLPDRGVNVAVWKGGGFAQLAAATTRAGGISVAVFVGGRPLVLIPGAPTFVNAPFVAAFPDGVPSGTIVLVVR